MRCSYRFCFTLLVIAGVVGWEGLAVHGQTVLYVDDDATGANDGSSWSDAYVYLQDALAAAEASGGVVSEVWVGQGVYKPDRGAGQTPGDRDATISLIDGVAIRGGYAGWGAADPDERDFAAYESVLSGDLDGDDATAEGVECCLPHDTPGCIDEACMVEVCADDPACCEQSWGDICVYRAINDCMGLSGICNNARHVVTSMEVEPTAVLEGLTITSGFSNETYVAPYEYAEGAGMYNDGGSPTVNDCTFIRNAIVGSGVNRGGALYTYGGSPVLARCLFTDNLENNP